ncbi:MAG: hypothetical protein EXQ48_07070 [Acidobacteria bacterium]|nr:hypothetical protein [Acidobacteriota bacterium]
MSKLCRTAVCALALVTAGACVSNPAAPGLAVQAIDADVPTGWFCPMHSDVTADGPGTCSKCGMALIAGNPFDTREYLLDVRTSPSAVRPGIPFRAQFTIRHPGTEKPVTALELVHDRRYHLFVMSRDLSEFQHLHPELQPDGSWVMDVTVPKPGYYWVASDFVPTSGSPQFLPRPLITAGFTGDIMSEAAHLTPDAVMTKTVDGITANVATEPAVPVAGGYGHLMFTLTDAATGQPVTDLQPYLGAFGHTLIVSEDLQDAVHSHPSPGPDSDVSRGRGGPRATFEGYLPRPGVYRAWTQFLRNDRLSTFTFTFRVWSLEEAVRITGE